MEDPNIVGVQAQYASTVQGTGISDNRVTMLLLLLSHIHSCQISRVRGHNEVLEPYVGRSEKVNEIKPIMRCPVNGFLVEREIEPAKVLSYRSPSACPVLGVGRGSPRGPAAV